MQAICGEGSGADPEVPLVEVHILRVPGKRAQELAVRFQGGELAAKGR